MDIHEIIINSRKTVTNTLNSNKAIEIYPSKFVAAKYKPTKNIPINYNIKNSNSFKLDKEVEKIKRKHVLENIIYLNDKDKRYSSLNTYANSDKINKIMCSEDLQINKDAISKPIDEKLIPKSKEIIYNNRNASYNNNNKKVLKI